MHVELLSKLRYRSIVLQGHLRLEGRCVVAAARFFIVAPDSQAKHACLQVEIPLKRPVQNSGATSEHSRSAKGNFNFASRATGWECQIDGAAELMRNKIADEA